MRKLAIAIAALAFACVSSARSQDSYPSKPVRLIVPFAAGTSDSVARIVSQKLSELLGQPVVIENKPGANGILASDFVARQKPDGYTIQVCLNSTHGLVSLFTKDVPFDPFRDFTMIGGVVSSAFALLVHSSVPANTMPEVLEFVKNNPQRRSVGSGGVGSLPHIAVELLNQSTKLGFQHVAYRGGGPAMNDLVAGHIPMLFATIGTAMEFVQAGRIKMIAVMGDKRLPDMPNLPAIGETVPGFDLPDALLGLCGPPDMPAPIVTRLGQDLATALKSPEIAAQLGKLAMDPAILGPEQFRARMQKDFEIFKRVTTAAGIRPE
jgi:tripartite-type tricarboxylate transporter receptor subunit TctC